MRAPTSIDEAMKRAVAHHQAGRFSEAEAIYRQVLEQEPNHADALHLLGLLASQGGRQDVSEYLIRRAISVMPMVSLYHSNLCETLRKAGKMDEAIGEGRRAVELEPRFADAYNNLGNALTDARRHADAAHAFGEAIALNANVSHFYNNLGNALEAVGSIDEAITAHRQAIRLNPLDANFHYNLGVALRRSGRIDEAISAYREAVRLNPQRHDAYNNLGNLLQQRGRLEEAIDSFLRAIEIKPDYTIAYCNLGNALQAGGGVNEAIEACRRALELDARCVPALNNLGNCYKDRGQLDLAIDHYRQAILRDPSSAGRHSNLVYCIHFHPDYDARRILEECLEWERIHALPLRKFITPHHNERSIGRKLRIGYVSPDFCNHVVAWNIFPLLEMHDRDAFEVFAYSDTLRLDAFTDQIRAQCDHWREIVGFGDEKVAETIRADGIDILVDLTLHMAQNRLPVFARKPAPVQVTYLGYCGTTGLGAIDYRMSDPYLDPLESDLTCYRETTVRLRRTYWCYRPGGATPEPGPLPAARGLPITFGCLNNFAKVSAEALELWIEILREVPDSRLLLNAQPGPCREATWDKMKKAGLSADRLEFVERGKWERYIENVQRIDLALDPFPYGGGISTCDALWMGVPVVSLSGRTAVGRGGRSILTNVGLPELVAETPAQYLEIAVSLARDLPRLFELHSTLRERMERSPLRDAPGFARDFETALREMWRKWCTEGSSL